MAVKLAGCVIRGAKGRILLLHRNTPELTQWELPGGKIEPGEVAEAAATREAQEELGVQVRVDAYLGSRTFQHVGTEFDYAWYSAVIIQGKPVAAEPELFDAVRYVSTDEILEKPELFSVNVHNFLAMIKARK